MSERDARAMATPLMRLDGFTVRFDGVQVLHGVDLQVHPGEALGLVGGSGSGKSVTWLAALGLLSGKAAVASFRKAWGLDDPIWLQYFHYFGAIAQGELGRSMRDGRAVIELVDERVPATLALTLPALLIKIGTGIPAGIYAALHRGSLTDRAVMMLSVAGFTIPSFVLGLIVVLIFAVKLGWLPSGGQDSWRHAILPILTLGIGGAAVLARFTRSAMLEVLGQPYIRTASAKGVPWARVVRGHALPNAAIPTVTIVGFMVGSLIAGAVVVESVFSWPGVGRLLVVAVANRDLAVVQCILLLVAATMVVSNLIVDFLYGLLDPHLRQSAGKAS
jgi:peptide/nickel transport system permease protein